MPISGFIETVAGSDSGRNSARWAVRLVAEGTLPGGNETEVALHNISAGGMLLDCAVPLDQGAEVRITLPEAGVTQAEVVWRSGTLHGCRFPQPLSPAVLSAAQLSSAIAPADEFSSPASPAGTHKASLGKRIAKLRQEKGMTLAQVAEAMEVSKPTVWAWEHDRSQPVAKRIAALSTVLGVPEAELLTGRDVSHAEHAIEEARAVVAEAYGCAPQQVRVIIDL